MIAYLVPLIFGAGSAVAALKYVGDEVDRLATRVDTLQGQLVESDRRVQELAAMNASNSRDVESLERTVANLNDRLSRSERNLAVLCARRDLRCEQR